MSMEIIFIGLIVAVTAVELVALVQLKTDDIKESLNKFFAIISDALAALKPRTKEPKDD